MKQTKRRAWREAPPHQGDPSIDDDHSSTVAREATRRIFPGLYGPVEKPTLYGPPGKQGGKR